jgi:DNA mismatch endonuclease (patch repair protein)
VNKIKRNQERDQQNYQVLHDNGWQVIVVWECQLTPKHIEETMLRVELLLNEHFLALHQPKPVAYIQEHDLPMAAEGNF